MRSRLEPLAAAGFLALLAYATLRYVVFQGVGAVHLPLYVVNKAVAVLTAALLAAAVASGDAEVRRRARLGALATGLLHVTVTLALLGPAYYHELYTSDDRLSGRAEVALLAGAVAIVLLVSRRWRAAPDENEADTAHLWIVLGLVAVHCTVLGAAGWVRPGSWPGGLPPMTLLAVLIAFVALVAAQLRRG